MARNTRTRSRPLLFPVDEATLSLPAVVGDYTDFYVGIHHATTVGSMFRPNNPLLPNYKWVPIAYHGRASTVQPSGRRSAGRTARSRHRTFRHRPIGPVADWTSSSSSESGSDPESQPGQPIPIGRAAEHVAGYCLLNDWSTRDVQAWEYQPLGPFLSKNFATTVSTWVITPEASGPVPNSPPCPARG